MSICDGDLVAHKVEGIDTQALYIKSLLIPGIDHWILRLTSIRIIFHILISESI